MDRSEENAVNRKRDSVVFDFDGVIHSYKSGWQGEAVIPDMPVPGIQKALKDISANGYEIVVVSTRCNSDAGIKAVNEYLKRFGLAQYISRVCKEKPLAICYIDDRSICFDGNSETLLEKIKTFKSWIERSSEERKEETEQSGMKSDGKDDEKWKIQKHEFEAAVKPIHEWLCKYGDPYTTVAVMQDRATVHQEEMTTPLPVPD